MLSIFITFVVIILNVNAISGTGSGKHFQILTKYAEVEKKAVEYAKWKDTYKGKLTRWGSNLVTDICNCSPEARINFCKKALHADHYGLEFDLDHYRHLPCKQQDFWTKSPIPFKARPFQVDMFPCPPIIYRDMATDEKAFLPYIFTASRGKSHDAVFTFVREKTSDITYPFQYIEKIDFKKLEKGNTADSLLFPKPMIESLYSATSSNNLPDLQFRGKKRSKIYEKFLNKFSSLNVCGLRQKYKSFICRCSFQSRLDGNRLQLPTEGYDGRCRRRPIDLPKNDLYSNKELSVVLCPSDIRDAGIIIQVMSSELYYISSNVFKHSTTLFHRRNNMRGAKLQLLKTYNNHYDVVAIMRDIQLDRFMPYPSEKERMYRARQRSFEEILNEINSLQHTPVGRRESEIDTYKTLSVKNKSDLKSIISLQASWLAEDLIISFSKIKKTAQVYKRFMDSYSSVDLYKLSDKGRQKICEQVLPIIDNNDKRAERLLSRFKVGRYHRRRVFFRVHEIENLETDTFSMWECEFSPNRFNYKYFVGKTHLRNIAVLYRSSFIEHTEEYYDENEVYPNGVITDINERESPSSGSLTEPQA